MYDGDNEESQIISLSYQRDKTNHLKNAQVSLLTDDYLKARSWSNKTNEEIYFEAYFDEKKKM